MRHKALLMKEDVKLIKVIPKTINFLSDLKNQSWVGKKYIGLKSLVILIRIIICLNYWDECRDATDYQYDANCDLNTPPVFSVPI